MYSERSLETIIESIEYLTVSSKIAPMIRATLVYLFIAVYLIVMAPVAMAWTALSRNTSFIYRAARFCIRAAGWMCGV